MNVRTRITRKAGSVLVGSLFVPDEIRQRQNISFTAPHRKRQSAATFQLSSSRSENEADFDRARNRVRNLHRKTAVQTSADDDGRHRPRLLGRHAKTIHIKQPVYASCLWPLERNAAQPKTERAPTISNPANPRCIAENPSATKPIQQKRPARRAGQWQKPPTD